MNLSRNLTHFDQAVTEDGMIKFSADEIELNPNKRTPYVQMRGKLCWVYGEIETQEVKQTESAQEEWEISREDAWALMMQACVMIKSGMQLVLNENYRRYSFNCFAGFVGHPEFGLQTNEELFPGILRQIHEIDWSRNAIIANEMMGNLVSRIDNIRRLITKWVRTIENFEDPLEPIIVSSIWKSHGWARIDKSLKDDQQAWALEALNKILSYTKSLRDCWLPQELSKLDSDQVVRPFETDR